MSVSAEVSPDGQTVTIRIPGRFNFHCHEDFRAAYSKVQGPQSEYVIDMSETEYMDSSALGMLLVLREHAGGDNARVRIEGSRDVVKDTLRIASFGKLFQIC